MIDHALAYAARGWACFPIEPRGKRPLIPNGSRGASRSPEQIASWWSQRPKANIAIATGKVSGLLVVDLDGAEGVLNFLALAAANSAPWATLAFRTGGGGAHLVYADATGLPNSASKLAERVDTRGEGGYIVAPPSVHPNGNTYRLWMDRPIIDVPTWVRRALRPPVERPRIPASEFLPRRGGAAPVPGGRDRLEDWARQVAQAESGRRNETLNRAAFCLGRDVVRGHLTEVDVIVELTHAAKSAGLTRIETERTIRSGLVAGMASSCNVPAPYYWRRSTA